MCLLNSRSDLTQTDQNPRAHSLQSLQTLLLSLFLGQFFISGGRLSSTWLESLLFFTEDVLFFKPVAHKVIYYQLLNNRKLEKSPNAKCVEVKKSENKWTRRFSFSFSLMPLGQCAVWQLRHSSIKYCTRCCFCLLNSTFSSLLFVWRKQNFESTSLM